MKRLKNILLLIGICLYVTKALFGVITEIIYSYMSNIPPFTIETFAQIFAIILCMTLPTVLLILNLKNKSKKIFSIIVVISSFLSIVIVVLLFNPVLSYWLVSKMFSTNWAYLIISILPNYGFTSLISFLLITIGAILSIKKSTSEV